MSYDIDHKLIYENKFDGIPDCLDLVPATVTQMFKDTPGDISIYVTTLSPTGEKTMESVFLSKEMIDIICKEYVEADKKLNRLKKELEIQSEFIELCDLKEDFQQYVLAKHARDKSADFVNAIKNEDHEAADRITREVLEDISR